MKHVKLFEAFLNENGMFKPDYTLTKNSKDEDFERFIKDVQKSERYERGVMPISDVRLLIKALREGNWVTSIEVASPKDAMRQVGYYYWKTSDKGIYDPGNTEILRDELKKSIK